MRFEYIDFVVDKAKRNRYQTLENACFHNNVDPKDDNDNSLSFSTKMDNLSVADCI